MSQCAYWAVWFVWFVDDAIFGSRCTKEGTHRLFAPGHKTLPSGPMCLDHVKACRSEYRDKLGERWTYEKAS